MLLVEVLSRKRVNECFIPLRNLKGIKAVTRESELSMVARKVFPLEVHMYHMTW